MKYLCLVYGDEKAMVLIHRRRAYLSGAAHALSEMLTAWPSSRSAGRGPARRAP